MNNSIRSMFPRSFVAAFSLALLVLLLITLATGLLWCQPVLSAPAAAASPVGTWVSADAWERGSADGDIIVEFTDTGLVNISVSGFSALYRYEDNQLLLFDMDSNLLMPDGSSAEPAEVYDCVITGDYMTVHGHIPGIMGYHGRCDLIRISDSTGLSAKDIAGLY